MGIYVASPFSMRKGWLGSHTAKIIWVEQGRTACFFLSGLPLCLYWPEYEGLESKIIISSQETAENRAILYGKAPSSLCSFFFDPYHRSEAYPSWVTLALCWSTKYLCVLSTISSFHTSFAGHADATQQALLCPALDLGDGNKDIQVPLHPWSSKQSAKSQANRGAL